MQNKDKWYEVRYIKYGVGVADVMSFEELEDAKDWAESMVISVCNLIEVVKVEKIDSIEVEW